MDTYQSMRVFAKVAEAESFAEAARRLRMSPPMVTRHIRNLEERVGARLINRTTHRFSLTEAGAMYHERCVRLLSDLEEAEDVTGTLNRLPHGRLRISAPVDFGRLEVWPIVRDFMRRYPDIQISMALTNRQVDLVEEGIDLAIRISRGPLDGSLVARKLATSQLVVCASPAYWRRCGKPKVPEDLLGHKCLLYGSQPWHARWQFNRGNEERYVEVAGFLQTDQLSLLSQAAVEGEGAVMQPTFSVWRELGAGKLKTALDDWTAGAVGIYVVFPSRRFLAAKTRLFIDQLTSRFRNDPDQDVWSSGARPASKRQRSVKHRTRARR